CAEMIKLLENTFRSVNIGLVNEIALMCDRLQLDVWEVIDAAATKPFGFMPFYPGPGLGDRKSTRLNSSHVSISYAGCCLKKNRLAPHKVSNAESVEIPHHSPALGRRRVDARVARVRPGLDDNAQMRLDTTTRAHSILAAS